MRILLSFILRLSEILSTTATLCFLVMGITLGIQLNQEGLYLFSGLAFLTAVWVFIVHFIIKKVDPELVVESARFLYPGGGILSMMVSIGCMVWLDQLIPGEGVQHYTVGFVGFGVLSFLIVRCFDIKWLRNEEEIHAPMD